MTRKTTVKYYKDISWGTCLYDAIHNTASSGYTPSIIQDWLDEAAMSYMEKEHDGIRLYHVVWNLQSAPLIVLLSKLGIDCDVLSDTSWRNDKNDQLYPFDRFLFSQLRSAVSKVDVRLIGKLEVAFYKDLRSDRQQYAQECAQTDYECLMEDVDEDDDKEVSDFFGITSEILSYKIGARENAEYAPKEIFICPNCDEANSWKRLYEDHDAGNTNRDLYYCLHCGDEGKFNEDFMKKNMHLHEEFLVALKV